MQPKRIFLIRHGESEGNVASAQAKAGDVSMWTPEFTSRPGSDWHLTDKGVAQAQAAGEWLRGEFATRLKRSEFVTDHFVSPFRRTMQTAHHLGLVRNTHVDLPSVRWDTTRLLRERDWGDMDTLTNTEYANTEFYVHNGHKRRIDPMYWRAPGGESMADLVDVRVPGFLALSESRVASTVVAVTHGEMIRAFLIHLLGFTDSEYHQWVTDGDMLIGNGAIIELTREVPGEPYLGPYEKPGSRGRAWPCRDRFAFWRTINPTLDPATGTWGTEVGEWITNQPRTLTNDDLLAGY